MYYSTILLCGWIVLFCADIRAINYTDWHDVDEDAETLAAFGGRFMAEVDASTTVGMFHRFMDSWSNKDYSMIDVASMCRHL